MSDLKLSGSDLDLTGHQISLVTGSDAIAQQLELRLRMFLGEHFLDTRLGIPFYRDVLVKNPNIPLLRSIFKEAILTTPGVVSLQDLQVVVNAAARQLELSFSATVDTDEILTYSPFIIEL